MDLFVCQTGKKQVLLLRSEPHRVRCEFACCATLPWVTQAGNWSEEGGERWGWQRRRKKKKNLWRYFDLNEKDLMMFCCLPTASCSISHTSLGW